MHSNGQSWPLYLAFLIMLIGGIIGLIDPQLFSNRWWIALILLVAGLLVASLLYIPSFVAMFKGVGTFLNKTAMGDPGAPAKGTLLHRIGSTENPGVGTLLHHLQTLGGAIGDAATPAPGTVLDRLEKVSDRLETVLERLAKIEADAGSLLSRIGTFPNPEAGTILAFIRNLEAVTAAIGAADNPASGTLLARIGDPHSPATGTLLGRLALLEAPAKAAPAEAKAKTPNL
jgi:hypothetical protein